MKSELHGSGAGGSATPHAIPQDELARLLAEARSIWPGVEVDAEVYREYLQARLPPADDLAHALEQVHTKDLYLACACAQRAQNAIEVFEERLLRDVPAFIAHLRQPPELVDEVKQRVREALFVSAPAEPPKITQYSGRGALGGWLRLVAVRTALMMLRDAQGDPKATEDHEDELPCIGADPELDLLRARYRDDFRAAFELALQGLAVSERNVLRLHYVDGMTIDDLAVLYRRHRSTVARQIAAARRTILDAVRRELAPRLALGQSEIDSLMGALRSQLDVSLLRFLKKD
jgi:RNA polymerase sigma-70 factor (ECF subfamily)